jgi:putative nucleotidyltransferase with HDIG domain
MSDNLAVWLASESLWHQTVGLFDDLALSEPRPNQVVCANGLALNKVDAVQHLPNSEDQRGQAVFLDGRYDTVKAAAAHGWRTAWLNPEGAFAPEELPVQDVDLLDLACLPKIGPALENKPSLVECLDWWAAWDLPENVRRHSKTVAQSAYHLAVMLRNKGVQVDPILTQRGGLLHDIDKISTLQQTGAHGQAGADFLEAQGYPALAEIVREHIMSSILHPKADQLAWEVKLVYFCDKLVEGDQLVTFDQRLDALSERYPHYRETMERAAAHVWALGDQICSILSISDHEKLIFTLS